MESQKLIAEQSEEAGLSKEVLELFLGDDSFDIAKAILKMKTCLRSFGKQKRTRMLDSNSVFSFSMSRIKI